MDNRFGFFYSGSLGWNIVKENFFNVDVINDFKLRVFYGIIGNREGISRYVVLGNVVFDSYLGGFVISLLNFENLELKWEIIII